MYRIWYQRGKGTRKVRRRRKKQKGGSFVGLAAYLAKEGIKGKYNQLKRKPVGEFLSDGLRLFDNVRSFRKRLDQVRRR